MTTSTSTIHVNCSPLALHTLLACNGNAMFNSNDPTSAHCFQVMLGMRLFPRTSLVLGRKKLIILSVLSGWENNDSLSD